MIAHIKDDLVNEGIFYEIDTEAMKGDGEIHDIIYEVKFPDFLNNAEVEDDLAQIVSNIFHLNKAKARGIISGIPKYANEWLTSSAAGVFSDFEICSNLTVSQYEIERLKAYQSCNADTISSICLRAILYYRTAAYLEVNYQPDSIRMPIVTYLNGITSRRISKLSKQLISTADSKLREDLQAIDVGGFTLEIPSALHMVVKSCMESGKSKKSFLEVALELRKSSKISRFREWLNELELALNTDLVKYKKMRKKAIGMLKLKEQKDNLKDMATNTTLTIDPSGPSIANIPIGKLLRIAIDELKYHLSRHNRRLLLLHNLSTDLKLMAKDDQVKELLGRMNDYEIRKYNRLAQLRISRTDSGSNSYGLDHGLL